MKQKLLVLAFGMLFASCGNSGGDTATLQKKVDSLTAVVAGKGLVQIDRNSLTPIFVQPPVSQNSNGMPIDSFTITWSKAKQYTSNWKTFLTNENYRNQVILDTTASYIIPMSNIKHLLDLNGATYLIVYLGVNDQNKMTLVYEGALTVPSNDTIYEMPVKRMGPTKYALDNAYPCPTCAELGLSDPNYSGPQQVTK